MKVAELFGSHAGAMSDDEQTIERDFRDAARLARVLGESFGAVNVP